MEGFDISVSLHIASSTLMTKWRHRTQIAAEFHFVVRALLFRITTDPEFDAAYMSRVEMKAMR